MPSGPHQGWILPFSFPTGLAQSWTDGIEGEEGIACAEMQRKRAVGAPVLLSSVQGDGWARLSLRPALIYEKSAAIKIISKQLAEPKLSHKASSALSCQGNKASFMKKRKGKPCPILSIAFCVSVRVRI